VSKVTGYGTGRSGFDFMQVKVFFSSPYKVNNDCAPNVKLTTHIHLVPKLKNEWRYTSTPVRLHGVVLS